MSKSVTDYSNIASSGPFTLTQTPYIQTYNAHALEWQAYIQTAVYVSCLTYYDV
jgi:hypothetical protein